MRMRRGRIFALLISLILLASSSLPEARAGDWLTKGGSPQRPSINSDLGGLLDLEEAWKEPLELGQSATQPVVVGGDIYHLAGHYLWRVTQSHDHAWAQPLPRGNFPPVAVNWWDEAGQLTVSQSSPTYSPASGIIYFGTAYGRLWAYDAKSDSFQDEVLEPGCPIVGSPLVINAYGEEFVVVADRPNYTGEAKSTETECKRASGKVWLLWGANRPGGMKKVAYGGADFGGYITPSAVPASSNLEADPAFMIGTFMDPSGAIRMRIERIGEDAFELKSTWFLEGHAGFAGNFVSDGTNAYWLDRRGTLWGATLVDGYRPAKWPGNAINLLDDIGAERAFTNTEPAVEIRPDGTHLYVTLRNYSTSDSDDPEQGAGGTGNDGAVLAVNPSGQVKWYRRFGPADRRDGLEASINTAPLVIQHSNVMLFGDVNGYLYSYALDSANHHGGHGQPFLVRTGEQDPRAIADLLKPGERPSRGQFSWLQVSGVGVDPAMADGLVLIGVNYERADGSRGGRLVAYRVGQGYNLAWVDPPEPVALKVGQESILSNRVSFRVFPRVEEPGGALPEGVPKSLAELCGKPPAVYWHLARTDGTVVRELWPKVALPEIAHGGMAETAMSVEPLPEDPEEGYIVGIIDHPGVAALAGAHPAHPGVAGAVSSAAATGLQPERTCENGSELPTLPGGEPLSGLADNILMIPFTKGNPIHQCKVAGMDPPSESPIILDEFGVQVTLNYQNTEGLESTPAELRVWARSHEGVEPPEGLWEAITIPNGKNGLTVTATFEYLEYGDWQIVADLRCEHDDSPEDNQMVVNVVVGYPRENDLPGYGSVITE